MFNISTVISQRKWFRVKDFDDCWVIVALMLVWAITPWVNIINTENFRRHAGDPDDGVNDGGNIKETITGVESAYPEYKGKLKAHRNITRNEFEEILRKGRACSVMLMPGRLPTKLRDGVGDVPHQCAVLFTRGSFWFANPWSDMPKRWSEIQLEDILPALRDYTNGNGITCISFPTPLEMLPTHPLYKSTLGDAANRARAEGYNLGWNAATERGASFTAEAAGKIRSGMIP